MQRIWIDGIQIDGVYYPGHWSHAIDIKDCPRLWNPELLTEENNKVIKRLRFMARFRFILKRWPFIQLIEKWVKWQTGKSIRISFGKSAFKIPE
jgi:hypothetical protein